VPDAGQQPLPCPLVIDGASVLQDLPGTPAQVDGAAPTVQHTLAWDDQPLEPLLGLRGDRGQPGRVAVQCVEQPPGVEVTPCLSPVDQQGSWRLPTSS